jgi:asparagine synthase (glutamine-hydrolysing)
MEQLLQSSAFEQVSRFDPWADRLSYLQGGRDWMSAAQYCDLHTYLPLDILTKVDRMTMAHSIEARPPLLDHRLVEFAARIPSHLRLRETTTKYLLKQAMRGVLPDHINYRRKQGFAVPLAKWFRGDLLGFARDLLLSDTCRKRVFLDVGYLERLLMLNQRCRDLDMHLWTFLSFEMWCRRFLDAPLVTPKAAA